MNTIIYLNRHAETIDENRIRNTNEDVKLVYKNTILDITFPCLLKMN